MSAFEFGSSLARAAARLEGGRGPGRGRSDRGSSRLDPAVERRIQSLLLTVEKAPLATVQRRLQGYCEQRNLPVPSRATLYNVMDRVALPSVSVDTMPDAVRASLYNLELGDGDRVPTDQVAFYAFNHGGPRALSFASGLPWLSLLRASKLSGWRPKSLALLQAVMTFRGIT